MSRYYHKQPSGLRLYHLKAGLIKAQLGQNSKSVLTKYNFVVFAEGKELRWGEEERVRAKSWRWSGGARARVQCRGSNSPPSWGPGNPNSHISRGNTLASIHTKQLPVLLTKKKQLDKVSAYKLI